jgi:two-component system NtrC family sensor kinase
MPMNPLRTLQGKFTFYLSILIVAMMSALSYRTISREKGLMETTIIREGKALVESFAISFTNSLLYEEIGLVEEEGLLDNYITDLMQRKDFPIVYAMVLDSHGKVIAHDILKEVGNVYQDNVAMKALASRDTLVQYPTSTRLDISTPLAISTKRWGTLRIGISLENLKKDVSLLVLKYILYTGLFIVTAIVLIAFLFGLITKPLKLLTREMDETQPGDDPPSSPSTSQDEIGILRRSFYRLLKRIKDDAREREERTRKMATLGEMAQAIAHEIRNPITGMLAAFEIMRQESGKDAQRAKIFDEIHLQGDRIQKIVSNLLQFAAKSTPQFSLFDLHEMIDKVVHLFSYQIESQAIHLEKRFQFDLPMIYGDPYQIRQVLINIVINAVQAMPEGGTLRVRTSLQPGEEKIHLTIADTGKGISENAFPNLFKPFYTTKAKGAGLGLAVVEKIVEGHGGKVAISSAAGDGTTVEILLPMKPHPAETRERGSR